MTVIIIFLARYLVVGPVLILIFVWLRADPQLRRVIFMRTLVSFLIGYLIFDIAQYLVPETRPYLAQGIPALISNPPVNNSFPSGHTLDAFVAALLVLPIDRPLGTISLVLAVMVGVGRVLAHVHYPIDIVGGILIAVFSVVAGTVIFTKK